MKIFFKKLEISFLIKSAEIENATSSYKTALSEANVKTFWTKFSQFRNLL